MGVPGKFEHCPVNIAHCVGNFAVRMLNIAHRGIVHWSTVQVFKMPGDLGPEPAGNRGPALFCHHVRCNCNYGKCNIKCVTFVMIK